MSLSIRPPPPASTPQRVEVILYLPHPYPPSLPTLTHTHFAIKATGSMAQLSSTFLNLYYMSVMISYLFKCVCVCVCGGGGVVLTLFRMVD